MGDLFADGGASGYPGAIDTFTTQVDGSPAKPFSASAARASKINNLAQAILNIQNELGLNAINYARLAGRAGGQTLIGGTDAGDDLILKGTSHATPGDVILAPTGGNVGVGTVTPGAAIDIVGPSLRLTRYGASPFWTHQSANGTVGSPSQSLINDKLSTWNAAGYTNAGAFSGNVAAIEFHAAENLTATAQGGYLRFATVTPGTTSLTNRVEIRNTGLMPATNDGLPLGVSGTAWSDLFLASGAVINFAAGNITLTHATGLITLGGGNLAITSLPSASPGAGTKQLWYDPADGNRVKYAA